MRTIVINTTPGFNEWRDVARKLISNKIPPSQIIWKTPSQKHNGLFDDEAALGLIVASDFKLSVSKDFLTMAEAICCHSNKDKFDLLYKILWRINFENKNLLHIKTDDDVIKANKYAKAVYRDAYKITAFLRFRDVNFEGEEHFVAWYEPYHYTLERVLPFFKKRFKNMKWSILMPYRAAHWNGDSLTLQDNPDPSLFPKEDKIEQYWLTYYASIFNPARPKEKAMLTQMPKKYWKNMPETKLIEDLLRGSEGRVKRMIESQW